MPNLTSNEILEFRRKKLTHQERKAIKLAEKSNNPWDHKSLPRPPRDLVESAKVKIRDFHLDRTQKSCCYCGRSLRDAEIETDREHIIPKKDKKGLSYNLFNLSVSCKRCNMSYKKERTDHIVDFDTIEHDMFNPARYKIPHPNIDTYEDHIFRFSLQFGRREITTYKRKSEKGRFLYSFVNLRELCVLQLDLAQTGRSVRDGFRRMFGVSDRGL